MKNGKQMVTYYDQELYWVTCRSTKIVFFIFFCRALQKKLIFHQLSCCNQCTTLCTSMQISIVNKIFCSVDSKMDNFGPGLLLLVRNSAKTSSAQNHQKYLILINLVSGLVPKPKKSSIRVVYAYTFCYILTVV